MKAKIISCIISDSLSDYAQGQRYSVNQLIIPEADNLGITPRNGELHVWRGEGVPMGEVIAEIEVPSIIADTAKEFLDLREQLEQMLAHPSFNKYFAEQLPVSG